MVGGSRVTSAQLRPEADLIGRALAGDGLAYRQLVQPHLPMLLRLAARTAGSVHLAEDAVQEALTIAYQRLARYRPEASFRAYLAAIAVRQAHTLARSERRRNRREQAARAPAAGADPEQALHATIAAQRVRQALAQMSTKKRRAALLRLDAGLSYREIAQALQSTEGSVRVLVHTALKELRRRLSDLLEEKTAP